MMHEVFWPIFIMVAVGVPCLLYLFGIKRDGNKTTRSVNWLFYTLIVHSVLIALVSTVSWYYYNGNTENSHGFLAFMYFVTVVYSVIMIVTCLCIYDNKEYDTQ